MQWDHDGHLQCMPVKLYRKNAKYIKIFIKNVQPKPLSDFHGYKDLVLV